jgi:hypothetical protein
MKSDSEEKEEEEKYKRTCSVGHINKTVVFFSPLITWITPRGS